MKTLLTGLFSLLFLLSIGQTDNKILIQVQVVDKNENPIQDVYVVNMRTHEKDVSRANGVFAIWVIPDDSLAVSHISYKREIVSANSVLINPKIVLNSDNINIKEIKVSANQKSEMERAQDNIKQMKFDMRTQPDDVLTESGRVQQAVTANNRLARTNAQMLSIAKFSPSAGIKKIAKVLKKDNKNDFSSTKKTKEEFDKKLQKDSLKSDIPATDTIPKTDTLLKKQIE